MPPLTNKTTNTTFVPVFLPLDVEGRMKLLSFWDSDDWVMATLFTLYNEFQHGPPEILFYFKEKNRTGRKYFFKILSGLHSFKFEKIKD